MEAVTFDFWNTLCCEPPGGYLRGRRLEAMTKVLADAGVGHAGVVLSTAYDAAWLSYLRSWESNVQFTGRHAARALADEAERHFGIDAVTRRRLYEAFAGASAPAVSPLRLIDGVGDALTRLRARGIPLAIVCDVGFTPGVELRAHLEDHGLLGHFDAWAFSDEIGAYKPDPLIFRAALAGLGDPDPTRCAHVGDRRRTDVAGAMALGMRAVRLTCVFDDDAANGPAGDVAISDYSDLETALELLY